MPEVAETKAPLPVGGNHTDRRGEFTRPEIAAARRSWLTDSGRGTGKTGLFVPLSGVNKPAKVCSNRLPLVFYGDDIHDGVLQFNCLTVQLRRSFG